jgi:hypothetical protein
MEREQFAELYSKAQRHGNQLRGNSQLAVFFPPRRKCFPPVLGFGLPHDERPVPVVTIALNASASEFPDHLPMQDDVKTQWDAQANYFANPYEEWWSIARDMLRAATNGQLTYTGPRLRAAHVDFTAIVTQAGMDDTYNDFQDRVRDDVRRSWLEPSLTDTFVPLLSNLVQQNGTKAALVLGFAPASSSNEKRGCRTLMDAFYGSNGSVNFVGEGGIAGKGKEQPTVAWGAMTGRSVPEYLRGLPFFFVSRGPSSLRPKERRDPAKRKPLVDAAAKLAPRLGEVLGRMCAPRAGFMVRRRSSTSTTT